MIKRLQQLPHENEDKNQNIDDDDLAQVLSAKITPFTTDYTWFGSALVSMRIRILIQPFTSVRIRSQTNALPCGSGS
jgi:hypothetical protein